MNNGIPKTKKARRLKNGTVIYTVYSFCNGTSTICVRHITGRPFISDVTGFVFVPCAQFPGAMTSAPPLWNSISLADNRLALDNTYNWHRSFFSRKKAESYKKLLDSGCDVSSMFSKDTYNTIDIDRLGLPSIRRHRVTC